MYPKCCTANSFPDDDTIAIDYTQICNSGTSTMQLNIMNIMNGSGWNMSNIGVLLVILCITMANAL